MKHSDHDNISWELVEIDNTVEVFITNNRTKVRAPAPLTAPVAAADYWKIVQELVAGDNGAMFGDCIVMGGKQYFCMQPKVKVLV